MLAVPGGNARCRSPASKALLGEQPDGPKREAKPAASLKSLPEGRKEGEPSPELQGEGHGSGEDPGGQPRGTPRRKGLGTSG